MCDNCEKKSIIEVKKLTVPKRQVASLLEWMRANDVRELSSDGEVVSFRSTKKSVEKVEGTMSLLSISGVLGPSAEEALYGYRLSIKAQKGRMS